MENTLTTSTIFDIKAFKLSHEVCIIVPSTVNVNQTIDNTQYVNKIASELSILNGGSTITSGFGCWQSESQGLVKESVTIVSSSSESLDNLDKVYELAVWLKEEMTQESIAVKIDGILYLV